MRKGNRLYRLQPHLARLTRTRRTRVGGTGDNRGNHTRVTRAWRTCASWARPRAARRGQGEAARGQRAGQSAPQRGDPRRGGERGSPNGPGPGADARTVFQGSLDACGTKLPIDYAPMLWDCASLTPMVPDRELSRRGRTAHEVWIFGGG